ncbi:SET domain-containing protein [Flagellatimonas centrodinii]|uniref:SET domain-containing protein n=1 Tax=Flagellatimonas centrodinii TaxID=2806210 RepID=UPI001FEE9659|nr:SET domain-containing protein [Flagellatimonas centrodinii]ULQ47541.1 SET domain-containing protein [Flagellatimonas centrodinii]
MLHVAHFVGPSAIAGVGLFAGEAIAEGQLLYSCDPHTLIVLEESRLALMPPTVRDSWLRYCYRGRGAHRLVGAYYYCTDDARFFNHANQPNCRWQPEQETYVAACDIPAGTELTCNYFDFCEPEDVPYLADATVLSSAF